jgi:transcription elongation factor GreA
MANERIPMSREGYEKLKGELERMETVEMIAVTKRIAAARDLGDLSENAEYHAAREDQGLLNARINELKSRLSHAYLVDPAAMKSDEAAFGAVVKVIDLDLDMEETFHLVGPGEEDYDRNRILVSSPIGQALLGKKVGQVAEVQAPMGKIRFKITEISFAG